MKPSITFDAIFAALAVLSVGSGCSKADRAAAEPPAAAPAASAPTTPMTPPVQQPAATAAAPPPPVAGGGAVVDAGTERAIGKPAGSGKGGSASCGATGCSAEMRKGGK